jgi:hypothetical protein
MKARRCTNLSSVPTQLFPLQSAHAKMLARVPKLISGRQAAQSLKEIQSSCV